MKTKILGITKTYKKEIEVSEIDLLLYKQIHGEDWFDYTSVGERVRIIKRGKGDWEGEAIPIEIDEAIKTLQQLKNKGSNYCEIMYHSDHNGYVFNGCEIRASTEGEILQDKKNEEKRKKITKKIEALQKEYEKKNAQLSKFINE